MEERKNLKEKKALLKQHIQGLECNSYWVPSPLGKHGQGNPLKEGKGYDTICICVHGLEGFEHGLQSDETGDKVVKVDSHVCLCVAQDDQLE